MRLLIIGALVIPYLDLYNNSADIYGLFAIIRYICRTPLRACLTPSVQAMMKCCSSYAEQLEQHMDSSDRRMVAPNELLPTPTPSYPCSFYSYLYPCPCSYYGLHPDPDAVPNPYSSCLSCNSSVGEVAPYPP